MIKVTDKIDMRQILPILNGFGQALGIPFSKTEVFKAYDKYSREVERLDNHLKHHFQVGKIDYTGRSGGYSRHIGELIGMEVFGKEDYYYTGEMTSGYNPCISFKLEDIEYIIKNNKIPEVCRELSKDVHKIFKVMRLKSAVETLKGVILTGYGKNCRAYRDQKFHDIFWITTNINVGQSNRLSHKEIAPQNFAPEVRQLIHARPGYKIVSLDIKAQEVMIWLNGIAQDTAIKAICRKERDPYRSLVLRLGLELTPETRALAKIPILGKMRGMSDDTVLRDLGMANREMGLRLLNFINNEEEGMKNLYKIAREEAKNKYPMLRGLFGSVLPLEGSKNKNGKERQILSAYFQTTAAELLTFSLRELFLMYADNKIRVSDIQFLCTIHDEVVLMVKDEFLEEGKAIIEEIFLPKVEGWIPFNGEITVGNHYVSK